MIVTLPKLYIYIYYIHDGLMAQPVVLHANTQSLQTECASISARLQRDRRYTVSTSVALLMHRQQARA